MWVRIPSRSPNKYSGVINLAEHVGVFNHTKAEAATFNSADIVNDEGGVGLVAVIDVTAVTSSPSVVFTIQGKDPASGKYYDILASSAITGTGTTVLRVHPDLTAAANSVAKDMIPRVWRIKAVHGNANSISYTVGASMV